MVKQQKINTQGLNIMTGVVLRTKMAKTAVVEFERVMKVTKYDRYEKRLTRLNVHNPPEINAQDGDIVTVARTRPLSKTKHFTIVEKKGRQKDFELRKEALELAKVKVKKEETKDESS